MDKEQARDLIRQIAYNQHCIAFSKHCSQRMRERQVTSDDFLYVLMWGAVNSVQYNSKTSQWKCEVQGSDIEGDGLTLHIAINADEREITCITVI